LFELVKEEWQLLGSGQSQFAILIGCFGSGNGRHAFAARMAVVGRVLPLVASTGRSHDDGQGTAHLQPFA
jgi:hypothetical protein